MKKTLNKIIAAVIAASLTMPVFTQVSTAYYGQSKQEYHLDMPTQEEICLKYEELGIGDDYITEYEEAPSLTSPYNAGILSDKTLQQALNTLNFIRFVAGVTPVELNEEAIELAQHACLVNAVNDMLTHYPKQPVDMSDEMYTLGKKGAGSSNIGMGYTTIPSSLIAGYMEDSDTNNIDRVGHRRWLINPYMTSVGYGIVGRYTATYVFNYSRNKTLADDYIAWPPQNMPYELYKVPRSDSYAFSVNLSEEYDYPLRDKVTVDVYSEKQKKSWHFDKNDNDKQGEYFNVENSNYGLSKCIIFNTGELFPKNDKITVTIKGITKNETECPITYTVNLFCITEKSKDIGKCTVDFKDYSLFDLYEYTPCMTYTGKKHKPEITVKDDGIPMIEGTDYTIKYSDNRNIGTATVTITGKGYYYGSTEITFDIIPKGTIISKLYAKDNAIKVVWKKRKDVTGYEVRYSTNEFDLEWFYDSYSTNSKNKTVKTINRLKDKTEYYFQVRSFRVIDGRKYYSDWSPVKTIKTK